MQTGWMSPGSCPWAQAGACQQRLRRTSRRRASKLIPTPTLSRPGWIVVSLSSPLLVRGRQPGDRFRPLGMGGNSLKLADFLVNVKLPRRARAAWPLVVSQDEIVWVPGFRLAHPVRLRGETKEAIKIKLARE